MNSNRSVYKPVPVGEDLFVINDSGSCMIGICVRDQFALVVDSGNFPAAAAEIKKSIERNLNCTIELLFNTHYHSDHTFGNQSFDSPILAARRCLEMMNECLTSHWSEEKLAQAKDEDPAMAAEWRDLQITMPTMTFDDDLAYDFHGRKIIFRRFGGHSPDSSVLYIPDERLMFTGDIVFAGRYPTLLSHDGDPERWIDALGELLLYDVDSFVPGHGAVCDKKILGALRDYWRCLLSACREALRKGLAREDAAADLMGQCHLSGIPFDEFRHRRNVISVLHYLVQHDKLSGL